MSLLEVARTSRAGKEVIFVGDAKPWPFRFVEFRCNSVARGGVGHVTGTQSGGVIVPYLGLDIFHCKAQLGVSKVWRSRRALKF